MTIDTTKPVKFKGKDYEVNLVYVDPVGEFKYLCVWKEEVGIHSVWFNKNGDSQFYHDYKLINIEVEEEYNYDKIIHVLKQMVGHTHRIDCTTYDEDDMDNALREAIELVNWNATYWRRNDNTTDDLLG